ncbi:hypothetical protein FB563_6992 [Streptomyces puniciscabiei]|uniref:Uncharacterized protein n=1 Tax=Streptomyces puniciscabiei TaxID=164348 RepID=A0A542TJ45_9ACTN|nr:hypothetical protein [Streptomyces puniciscabiei]TQK86838.1 hypothetical protein FB563_6992 [Streptomyces puniciscabiei]
MTPFLLRGHQVMHTCVAPFAGHAGYGRRTPLTALTLFTGVLLTLGLGARAHTLPVGAVALWGVAFGRGADADPDALVDAS